MSTFDMSPKHESARPQSPGSIYHLEGIFREGIDKKYPIRFSRTNRSPVTFYTEGLHVEYRTPPLPACRPISIGSRIERRNKDKETTQAVSYIYEVEKINTFKTGPSFSFSKSKAPRFYSKDDKRDIQWVLDA
mmetsp:Transcript_33680/g.34305  ORF Transcript_33680/g.34305 Transcript_33680/m.34305 type:complete len:133 (+) Transcript_33680:162-560(+)